MTCTGVMGRSEVKSVVYSVGGRNQGHFHFFLSHHLGRLILLEEKLVGGQLRCA